MHALGRGSNGLRMTRLVREYAISVGPPGPGLLLVCEGVRAHEAPSAVRCARGWVEGEHFLCAA